MSSLGIECTLDKYYNETYEMLLNVDARKMEYH